MSKSVTIAGMSGHVRRNTHVQRGDAGPVIKSHYRNITGCFWLTVIFAIVASVVYLALILLMLSGAGFGATALVAGAGVVFTIWLYIRLIKGLLSLLKGKPWA